MMPMDTQYVILILIKSLIETSRKKLILLILHLSKVIT